MSNRETSCPTVPGQHNSEYERGDEHGLLLGVAIGCMALTLLISLANMAQHFRRYTVAKEQRQIVKILFTPVIFAIIAVASMLDYHTAPYITPIAELYSAFSLAALFLLYIQFAAPDVDFGQDMFATLIKVTEKSRKRDKANWPMLTWIAVFQLPISESVAYTIEVATEATGNFCPSSMRPRFGNFWVTLIRMIGVVTCFVSIIRFYGRMKTLMKVRRAVMKLSTLKGVVFVYLIQNLVFNTLLTQEVIRPGPRLSYGDWTYGVPGALLTIEMVIFSLLSWYAFSSSEYAPQARQDGNARSFPAAIIDSMNPLDLLLGVIRIFGLCGAARALRQPNVVQRKSGYQGLPNDWSGPLPQDTSATRGPEDRGNRYEHEMHTPAPAYSADDEAHLIPGGYNERDTGYSPISR